MTPKSKNEETRKPESLDPSPLPDPNPPTTSTDLEEDVSPENCECCRLLRENAIPAVGIASLTKSDFVYDRTISIYTLDPLPTSSSSTTSSTPSSSSKDSNVKIDGISSNRSSQDSQPSTASSSSSGPLPAQVPRKPKRLIDRNEESQLWDLIGLTPKMYNVLQTELTRITPHKLVFKKCVYRLHNTRHFQVPLNKKIVFTKEELLKQEYGDDRKLLKKKQAFHCHWEECPISFLDPQDMRIHYMFDHEAVKIFCCGEKYENYADYLEHYLDGIDDKKKKVHDSWSVRECWACQQRFFDIDEFFNHCHACKNQEYPAACPDALCEARFPTLTCAVNHFYDFHDKCGRIVINDTEYPTRESIQPDLHVLDDGQMAIAYPFRAYYVCNLCQVHFSAEKYLKEHVEIHMKNNQFWLAAVQIQCTYCRHKNCRVYREAIIKFIPNLMETVRNLPTFKCEKHPCLLIWRLFLAKDFLNVMQRVLVKLLDEHVRLEVQQEYLDMSKHPEVEPDLVTILENLYFMFAMGYESEVNQINEFHRMPADILEKTREFANGDCILNTKFG